jgi:hypothetical protein
LVLHKLMDIQVLFESLFCSIKLLNMVMVWNFDGMLGQTLNHPVQFHNFVQCHVFANCLIFALNDWNIKVVLGKQAE